MRSIAFATHSVSSDAEIVRGSSERMLDQRALAIVEAAYSPYVPVIGRKPGFEVSAVTSNSPLVAAEIGPVQEIDDLGDGHGRGHTVRLPTPPARRRRSVASVRAYSSVG